MILAIPAFCIKADKIIRYTEFEGINRKRNVLDISLNNLKENDTKGNISISAKKRIIDGINKLVLLSSKKTKYMPSLDKKISAKCTFITLTLPATQIHSDKEIKSKILNRFLEQMRYKHNLDAYLWRAESQKNGNIHFHLTTNVLIDYQELRQLWNDCLDKLGYIDRFEQIYKHRNPNSTDIHSVANVKNLGAYLAKYCTKENEYRKIEGRQWFLSRSLSNIPNIRIVSDGEVDAEINTFCRRNKADYVHTDYCTIAYISIFNHPLSSFPILNNLKKDYINKYKLN